MWVERRGSREITAELMTHAAVSGDFMAGLSPFVLSHHLWGFLQHGVTGEAGQIFKGEKRQDGFNVCGILALEINSKTDCHRVGLRAWV